MSIQISDQDLVDLHEAREALRDVIARSKYRGKDVQLVFAGNVLDRVLPPRSAEDPAVASSTGPSV